MNERIRELFETHTVPNFGPFNGRPHKNVNGEYHNPVIEDHWQTFQEAAELIVRECADLFVDRRYMVLNPLEPFADERVRVMKAHDKDTVKTIKKHFGIKEQQKVAPKPKCSVCGTTENVRYMGGYQPYLCDSVDCIPF